MKRLFGLLLFLACLFFVSCHNNNHEETSTDTLSSQPSQNYQALADEYVNSMKDKAVFINTVVDTVTPILYYFEIDNADYTPEVQGVRAYNLSNSSNEVVNFKGLDVNLGSLYVKDAVVNRINDDYIVCVNQFGEVPDLILFVLDASEKKMFQLTPTCLAQEIKVFVKNGVADIELESLQAEESVHKFKFNPSTDEPYRVFNMIRDKINQHDSNNQVDMNDDMSSVSNSSKGGSSRYSASDYSWMNGNWLLQTKISDPYVGSINIRVSLTINTSNKTIVVEDLNTREIAYRGTYTINETSNMISCGGNYFRFDPERKQFYEEYKGRRDYYSKN